LRFTSGGNTKMNYIKKNTWVLLVAGFAILIAIGIATT
jgi:hypothetical protein